MRQEGEPPGAFPARNPLVCSGAEAPPKQEEIPSQVGCLADRTHVEAGGAAEALHSSGGLWQPPRRARMDPEHGEATGSSKG